MEEKEKSKMPPSSIKVKIGSNEYEIKYPTIGQLIDIETKKASLTAGTQKDMIAIGTTASMEAYIFTEASVTFSVLIPDLTKDLNVKSLLDLNPKQAKSFSKSYETYYSWINQWREYLNSEDEI